MHSSRYSLVAALSLVSITVLDAGCYDLSDCEACLPGPPPALTCPGPVRITTATCGPALGAAELGAFAVPAGYQVRIDNMPPNNRFPPGTTALEYSLLDAEGATVQQCTQTVTVADESVPVVKTKELQLFVDDYPLAGATEVGFDLSSCIAEMSDCGGALAVEKAARISRIEFWAMKCENCGVVCTVNEVCVLWDKVNHAALKLGGTTATLPIGRLADVASGSTLYQVFFTVTGANGRTTDAVCKVNLYGRSSDEKNPPAARTPIGRVACIGDGCESRPLACQ